jgi:hypothetical protein
MDAKHRRLGLWNYTLSTELCMGTQFLTTADGDLYVVLGLTNEIFSLPREGRGGDRWHSYVHTMYGITAVEPIAKFIYSTLRAYVLSNGTRVELRRFAAFDQQTQTAYLSAYNGQMFKIESETEVSTCACGEDGKFFVDDDEGAHVPPDIGPHGILLDRLMAPNFAEKGLSGITPEQQRMALTIWFFALAFPDLMPTKPIMLIEGTKGSGKTSQISLIQLALTGIAKPMMLQRNKEDDFNVILLRSPIALFDNTDSYIDWVPDAIANYCTGGVVTKRRLYTDDESMTIRAHAFIAVATRNPASFRRDDVADRCIILRLERRAAFTSAARLKREILADRGRLLGEYIWYIGRIVAELRNDGFSDEDETHRMADFAAFGRVIGKVLGWAPEAVAELMLALQAERDAFINEEDPLIDLLEKWIAYKPRSGRANAGRVVTQFELHAELETFAQANNVPFKDSPRSLVQKIRSTHIERAFRIKQIVVGGHKSFQLFKSDQPDLEVVG